MCDHTLCLPGERSRAVHPSRTGALILIAALAPVPAPRLPLKPKLLRLRLRLRLLLPLLPQLLQLLLLLLAGGLVAVEVAHDVCGGPEHGRVLGVPQRVHGAHQLHNVLRKGGAA